jgi:hypothetical protein
MMISNYENWIKIAKLSEQAGNHYLTDQVINKLIKIAQPIPFTPGTVMQQGQTYDVPTDDHSVFDKVATTGDPDYANVGGAKVLVTHGSANGMWLVSDDIASQVYNNNPDLKTTGQLGENDTIAGIQAKYDESENRLWLDAKGMQKYLGGTKWLGCYDLIGGKGFGAYGGSKDPISVITQTDDQGQQKTYLQSGN